jgi:prevent-host-death family protein
MQKARDSGQSDPLIYCDHGHDYGHMMRTIKASEFKANCLHLMDEVERTGDPIVITKNGRPIAQLGPLGRRPDTLFGAHRGLIEITGDVISPIDDEWEAER